MKYAVEVLIGEEWSRLKRLFPSRASAESIAAAARPATIVKDARVVFVESEPSKPQNRREAGRANDSDSMASE